MAAGGWLQQWARGRRRHRGRESHGNIRALPEVELQQGLVEQGLAGNGEEGDVCREEVANLAAVEGLGEDGSAPQGAADGGVQWHGSVALGGCHVRPPVPGVRAQHPQSGSSGRRSGSCPERGWRYPAKGGPQLHLRHAAAQQGTSVEVGGDKGDDSVTPRAYEDEIIGVAHRGHMLPCKDPPHSRRRLRQVGP